MKAILLVAALLLPTGGVFAQDTQIAASFVLREQRRLGYLPHNPGFKIEYDYRFNDDWTLVVYATGLRSPKRDSGTGKLGFVSGGIRWAPLQYKEVKFFGEFDAIIGALVTDPYRKTVFHFRNAIGVKILDGRLMFDVARLYQDLLPDAAKLLKERGFDPSALHTTFSQVSGWDYEGQYWTQPWNEGRWGLKIAMRVSTSKFTLNQLGERGHGWFLQYEVGPFRKFLK